MLYGPDGKSFATGKATYYDTDLSNLNRQNAIYPQIILPLGTGISVYALVNTGAPYCIFDNEITQMLGLDFSAGEPIELSTRVGKISGTIQRLPITLAAEEGNSLEIDASVFVSEQWYYGHFLGYSGFLERFRFVVDPATNSLFFGPSD